jgi:hypothetical protein
VKTAILFGSFAAGSCLGLAAPVPAAQPASDGTPTDPAAGDVVIAASQPAGTAALKPAHVCLDGVRAFTSQMHKDGYRRGGSDYANGYPMGGDPASNGYQDVRPGHELRSLVVAATILARKGHQQSCEEVLATGRAIYKANAADPLSRGANNDEEPSWQQQQIKASGPVAATNIAFRPVQLIDADERMPQGVALGSIHDLVMSPKTGKLAYVAIGRSGIFDSDETYTPVPWDTFKIAPNATLLMLDTTKAIWEAAPTVKESDFATPGAFENESAAVDANWATPVIKVTTN